LDKALRYGGFASLLGAPGRPLPSFDLANHHHLRRHDGPRYLVAAILHAAESIPATIGRGVHEFVYTPR
jgi:hypothetical protein